MERMSIQYPVSSIRALSDPDHSPLEGESIGRSSIGGGESEISFAVEPWSVATGYWLLVTGF